MSRDEAVEGSTHTHTHQLHQVREKIADLENIYDGTVLMIRFSKRQEWQGSVRGISKNIAKRKRLGLNVAR